MNPYDPPQAIDNEGPHVDVVQSEGNFRVFAAGVAMVVVGAGLILFRHLAHSFSGGRQSPPMEQDWLYYFVAIGVLLTHFGGKVRRRSRERKVILSPNNTTGQFRERASPKLTIVVSANRLITAQRKGNIDGKTRCKLRVVIRITPKFTDRRTNAVAVIVGRC
ncbi:hypothetical protein [Planctomycetes bacterium K23_9]|uniref:Transmembrane protein n=1 Tax=Stieleria marina TaxID=1930275 RepID=A0A517NLU6_9BACT|nr:hypothetical protein K239x_00360 [Planctomycetes bacterium K23_9]